MIKTTLSELVRGLRSGLDVLRAQGLGQVQFWFIALALGVLAGLSTVAFRFGISFLQTAFYGTDDPRNLHSFAQTVPWWVILTVPILGGLVVGFILTRFTPDARVRSVADVIEGAALREGRVEVKAGLASACASCITLGTGGSTGREGPVVHLAGVISTKICNVIRADGVTGRDLLGCAVAAAVSASFNAPIAGALFALEVILRHFAVHAFAPIVIASVGGTIVSRAFFGDFAEYSLPAEPVMAFYVELPAFLILGLICGLVAVIFMRSVFFAERLTNGWVDRFGIPAMLRPALAGACLGGIAIYFPHIIGVGYETTYAALNGDLLLWNVIVFALVKALAVAITMSGKMGGGIFSPSLMIGAMTGLAFGIIATSILPAMSGDVSIYALAGLGAVAAAVLGAPISTTLIVFELTGDWQAGLAVMVAVSMSTAVSTRLVHKSHFLTQLVQRGVHVAAGPQAYLLATFSVAGVMRDINDPRMPTLDRCWEMIEHGTYVDSTSTLEVAMPIFEQANVAFVPVVTLSGEGEPPQILGALFQFDALKAYNRALAATAAEEHA